MIRFIQAVLDRPKDDWGDEERGIITENVPEGSYCLYQGGILQDEVDRSLHHLKYPFQWPWLRRLF